MQISECSFKAECDSIPHSALGTRHSALGARHSALGTRHSALGILHCIPHSAIRDRGADPNVCASLHARLGPGHGETSLHEYRDVTPLSWGERFHEQIL